MKNFITTSITIIVLIIIFLSVPFISNAQEFTRKGNEYSCISSTGVVKSTKTQFTFKDKKNNVYPIYITDKGRCFIIKTSAKTNKDYKSYLSEDISKDICKQLNINYTYKPKTKSE